MKVLLKREAVTIDRNEQEECMKKWGKAMYNSGCDEKEIKAVDMNEIIKKRKKMPY